MSLKSIIKFIITSRGVSTIRNNKKRISLLFYFIHFKYIKNRVKNFSFNNKQYSYFWRSYNKTFQNERAIELPIILDYISKSKGQKILEIGNVVSHYLKQNYDIVDKYEIGDGVLNYDINDFNPKENYDLIISISTFEHIGFDEAKRYSETKGINVESFSLLKAIEKTKNLLNPKGKFIFTVPMGFNGFLDDQIKNNNLNLSETFFFKRVSSLNEWKQVQYEDVQNSKYGEPYICANGLMIGVYHKN